jgi:hypothetical protein
MEVLEMREVLRSSTISIMTMCAALSAVAVVGCDDGTTEPGEPLTLAEAEALYRGINELSADTARIAVTTAGGVIACPLGGQATVGVEPPTGTDGPLRLATTLDPDGCGLSSGGYDFTLDGNPNVRTDLTITIDEATFDMSISGSVTGGVDWVLDDRSGTCMIDLALSTVVDGSGPALVVMGTVSGRMCGLEVEFEEVGIQTPV